MLRIVSCSGSASICREKSLKMLNVDLVFVDGLALLAFSGNMKRSEERRVGKECRL